MTETRIAFLYKAASMLSAENINKTQEKLRSYYRMQCKEIAKGYGLPQKHFSEQVMCTHCCLEWKRGTEIKVRRIKLSRRQRKRIKSQKIKLEDNASKVHLLCSNEIEQICTFCKHSTKTVALKPNKSIVMKPQQPLQELKENPQNIQENLIVQTKHACNVYSKTAQVFSLNNEKNSLKSKVKEPKVIKNSKKKKDKFAGLCQKAVLISAQLKQEKVKQNKLCLFLKPSS